MYDFNRERIYIELTFLANGYSLEYVEAQVQQFLKTFNAFPLPTPQMEILYEALRSRLFRWIEQQQYHYEQDQTLQDNNQLVHLHYLFDWGLRRQFNEKFHQLWSQLLKQDATFAKANLKIRLNSHHCYSSNALLAQQASHRHIL